jgi:hypothetical protein
MTLCNTCKVLAKELFKKSTYGTSFHKDSRRRYYIRKIRHLWSILDVLASTENCALCALIRIGFEKYKSDETNTGQDLFGESEELHEPLVIYARGDPITHQNPDSLGLHNLGFNIPTNGSSIPFLGCKIWATKGTRFGI